MAEVKTRPTKASVAEFIAGIGDEVKRKDAKTLIALMKKHSKAQPIMWGPSIIGFGSRAIKYADGRELDWPVIAFSPRKQALTLYLAGLSKLTPLLGKLGKHQTSKACLYIKRLSDVDMTVLEAMIAASLKKKA